MSTSLVHVNPSSEEPPFAITQAQAILRQMVLDSCSRSTPSATMLRLWMICMPSVPADLSPARAADGISNYDGSLLSINY
jgi:hypothetical protein